VLTIQALWAAMDSTLKAGVLHIHSNVEHARPIHKFAVIEHQDRHRIGVVSLERFESAVDVTFVEPQHPKQAAEIKSPQAAPLKSDHRDAIKVIVVDVSEPPKA